MRLLPLLAAVGFLAAPASAQISVTLTPTRIDFNDFRGMGFTSTPAPGQLDADDYAILGMSDGQPISARPQFGVTQTTGDFARGMSAGGVGTGGVYAFNTDGAGDYALGFQPAGAFNAAGNDFNPGAAVIRLRNTTAQTIYAISVSGDIKVFNDQGRSTRIAIQVVPDVVINGTGVDTGSGTPQTLTVINTPLSADATPTWVSTHFAGTAEGIEISPNEDFYIQLRALDNPDNVGSGSRDEIALDNIVVSFVSETLGSSFQAANNENVAGWRMLAPVVNGSTIADLADDNLVQGVAGSFPGAGANVFVQYRNADGSGDPSDFTNPAGVSTATPLESGKGFIWYLYDRDDLPQSNRLPDDVSYSGTIQTTDVVTTFGANADAAYLAGNPFNRAFTLTGVSAPAGFVLGDAFSIWNPVSNSYVVRSATNGDRVSRGQGFFAEMSTQPTPLPATVGLTYAAASQTNTATDLLGRVAAFVRAGFTLSGLTSGGAQTYDEAAYLVFTDEATAGHDRFDGTKFMSLANPSAEIAFVGEKAGTVQYRAQESRPVLTSATSIPVALRVRGAGGEYTLRWPGVADVPTEWALSLTDAATGATVDLRSADGYTFTASATEAWVDRFTLAVAPQRSVATEGAAGVTVVRAVYPNPASGEARIAFSTASAERVVVRVYDALGRLVATPYDAPTASSTETVVALPRELSAGTYVVRVVGETFSESRRLSVVR